MELPKNLGEWGRGKERKGFLDKDRPGTQISVSHSETYLKKSYFPKTSLQQKKERDRGREREKEIKREREKREREGGRGKEGRKELVDFTLFEIRSKFELKFTFSLKSRFYQEELGRVYKECFKSVSERSHRVLFTVLSHLLPSPKA